MRIQKTKRINRDYFLLAVMSVIFGFAPVKSKAQNLDYNSKVLVTLNDGTPVTLYAQLQGSAFTATLSKDYYFLPTQVMLAKDPATQVPNFLFLKYISDEREDQGGVSGALMHFLMQTGFTQAQMTDMQSKLAAKVSGAVVKGPVDLFAVPDANSFTITSAVVNTTGGMTKSMVTSGKAPLQQGGKVAVAANLNKFGAQLMAATFEKTSSVTDLSVNLFYKYYLKVNGLKGKIIVDYEKIHSIIQNDVVDGKYVTESKKGQDKQVQTWNELHSKFEDLVEKNAIIIKIDQGFPNATTEKITEMFFQLFLDKFTVPATDRPPVAPTPTGTEAENLPGKKNAYNYYLNIMRFQQVTIKKKDSIVLNYDYLMPMELSVTQNLKTFYDAARDNPKCIGSVLLNDNFYKHMDIRFVLDLEAKEMFDQEINYVDVRARRKDSKGGYVDLGGETISKDYVGKSGITAQITYAGGDDNRDMYQYKTQWSLRGGNKYPANPQWEQGQMQAVTLNPPVAPRLIEFEADLEKLKATGITRVTLQVRYKKFDQEIEANLNISPVQGQALVNKLIFMDRDTRGYVYRLIFNHQVEGKLALPWSSKLNDNYVYAVIPNDMSNKDSELFIKAVDAAKTIVQPGPDGKVTTDKILDKFKEILGVTKTN